MTPRSIKTNILYNGINADIYLSDVMSEFEFSDATEESDSISMIINDPDQKWSGSWMPESGDEIQADIVLENWERRKGKQVISCGRFLVDSFCLTSPPQVLTVEGVSSPVHLDFKETKHTQAWEKVTIRQIAAEISSRYDLTLVYDSSQEITLDREEQNEMTDSAYLKALCNRYGFGLKVYYSQLVIWSYEEYEAKPSVLTIHPDMTEKWSYKGSIQGTYTGARVTYSDPAKEETLELFVGQEGRILTVNGKAESLADAERIGKNAIRSVNRRENTVELTLLPPFCVLAASTVSLEGFGKIDGTYFVSRVHHRLSSKIYSRRVSLYRISQETARSGEKQEREVEKERKYFVKKGDTLWNLAASFYQDNTQYRKIYESNRDVIEEEAKRHGKTDSSGGYWIYPGTELVIP